MKDYKKTKGIAIGFSITILLISIACNCAANENPYTDRLKRATVAVQKTERKLRTSLMQNKNRSSLENHLRHQQYQKNKIQKSYDCWKPVQPVQSPRRYYSARQNHQVQSARQAQSIPFDNSKQLDNSKIESLEKRVAVLENMVKRCVVEIKKLKKGEK